MKAAATALADVVKTELNHLDNDVSTIYYFIHNEIF
jgi:hypothetical protein